MREHESQLKRMISEVGGQTKQGLTGVNKTFQDCVRVDETVHVDRYMHMAKLKLERELTRVQTL